MTQEEIYARAIGQIQERRRNAEAVQGIRRPHAACLHILMHPVVQIHNSAVIRQLIPVARNADPYQPVSRILHLRRDNVFPRRFHLCVIFLFHLFFLSAVTFPKSVCKKILI